MKKIIKVGFLVFSIIATNSLAGASNHTTQVIKGYDFQGNGWQSNLDCFDDTFHNDQLADISLLPEKGLDKAIYNQLSNIERKLLNGTLNDEGKSELQQKVEVLEEVQKRLTKANQNIYLSGLKYKRLAGEDGCGNVLLTGYFTPTLKLKRQPDKAFRYPIYAKPLTWPKNKVLSREEIDDHKGLAGLGLEIGYSDSLLDNYFVHVQGSTYAHFIDTNEYVTLAFAGKNGKEYQSLGKYLVSNEHIENKDISLQAIRQFFDKGPERLAEFLNINPSYVFFSEVKSKPITSSGVPVVNNVTAAVDPSIIPHGSILLVEFPVISNDGKVSGRELRLLIASDSGSAIKGTGHIDIYMGKNQQQAGLLHHYGQVWVLENKGEFNKKE